MRRVILAIVSTAVGLVLLLTFKTHGTGVASTPPAAISTPSTGGSSSGGSSSGGSASGGSASGGSAAGSSPSATPSSGGGSSTAAKTVTGAAADTRYGPVQVQITVKNGKVTAAQAVEYPQDTMRDVQINSNAVPELNQEAVAAGSARIDMVSGATYTSQGYISSLQSALDQAGL